MESTSYFKQNALIAHLSCFIQEMDQPVDYCSEVFNITTVPITTLPITVVPITTVPI